MSAEQRGSHHQGAGQAPRECAAYGENGAQDLGYDPDHCGRVVTAHDVVRADAAAIFELIADPSQQSAWDGNENLAHAEPGQRVRAVGDVFRMTLTNGKTRENHVVEFLEGELIAWRPATMGEPPAGHLWRWSLAELSSGGVEVTHTYDWSQLTDEARVERARTTTAEMLAASVSRLKALAESA
ncbi:MULTISPECIES: SRPBCC family protein [unclassified Nesterenkonia]|uniref:SRPBCC family protein n=1 Tax=unclassified Nesterenkonia TaxID=2629769 RepID=UPI000AD00B15|nr:MULTISPECIES: SRPBCC family protein [unclassified Nesterenkonia]MDS2174107.1 SRPBCC family protein [Nesterenkonia sp. CL21]